MNRALQTRRQRLRRLRELRGGTTSKAAAGGAAVLLLIGVVLMTGVVVAVLSIYRGYVDDLPADPRAAFEDEVLGPAQIFDRHGTLLYEFEDENEGLRNPVSLRDVSEWVIKATIATEDNSFYDNPGVNVRGLARAGLENFTDIDTGMLQGSGGSSITQQLVKNVFIPYEQRYERNVDRKLKETALALELTRKYSKAQILEWYLNTIHYGNRTNGIEAAARRYFGVHASELTLGQAALLAGLPQSPARYDPYRYPEAAIARQHEVLDLMVHHGHITEAEAAAAKAEPPRFELKDTFIKAPHWVFYVRDQLIAQFGERTFKSGGLRVTTTLDLALNERAEQIIKEKIAFYESPRGGNCQCHNGALVAIDNRTGEILAMVGSRDYWRVDIEGENNNAIAIKQPGSALKPLVYLAAFMKGWNPGTLIYDQPTRFLSKVEGNRREYFMPSGPNRTWHGPMTARSALGNSINTPAVKAAGYVGVSNFIDLAHKMGLKTMDDKENYGVSIATGGSNLTLLDLTYAYSVLANNGEMRGAPALGPKFGVPPNPEHRKLDPVAILKVTNANGEVLYEYNEDAPGRVQVVPPGYAYQVTDILKDNDAKRLTYGNAEAQFGMPDRRPVAAKTGTQQGPRDIGSVLSTWNFGYTPDLTVGVWVGNQDNKLVNPNLTSASSSLLIWREFMIAAFAMLKQPPREFPVPPDIKWVVINGRREPIVDGQKIILTEDPRLWAADGNAVPAGAQPEPRPLENCRAVRERDTNGQERTTLFCSFSGPTAVPTGPLTGDPSQPDGGPSGLAGTGTAPVSTPSAFTPSPTGAPVYVGTPVAMPGAMAGPASQPGPATFPASVAATVGPSGTGQPAPGAGVAVPAVPAQPAVPAVAAPPVVTTEPAPVRTSTIGQPPPGAPQPMVVVPALPQPTVVSPLPADPQAVPPRPPRPVPTAAIEPPNPP